MATKQTPKAKIDDAVAALALTRAKPVKKGTVIDGIDCSGMTDDPKRAGIPIFLQVQNRRTLTPAQEQHVKDWLAKAHTTTAATAAKARASELTPEALKLQAEVEANTTARRQQKKEAKRGMEQSDGKHFPGSVWRRAPNGKFKWQTPLAATSAVNAGLVATAAKPKKEKRGPAVPRAAREGMLTAHDFAKDLGCAAKLVRRALRTTKAIPKPAGGWLFTEADRPKVVQVVGDWLRSKGLIAGAAAAKAPGKAKAKPAPVTKAAAPAKKAGAKGGIRATARAAAKKAK